MTVEEATVGDSGRVQESIQGRHLITPDELISLDKQVIVFTADTKPLKLPLTDPLAYEQALSYDKPVREKHKISEFVKTRGQVEDEPPAPKPEPPKEEPPVKKVTPQEPVVEKKEEEKKTGAVKPLVSTGGEGKPERGTRPEKPKDEDNDRRPTPKRDSAAPDYDL